MTVAENITDRLQQEVIFRSTFYVEIRAKSMHVLAAAQSSTWLRS
jgi:hypothetical protein